MVYSIIPTQLRAIKNAAVYTYINAREPSNGNNGEGGFGRPSSDSTMDLYQYYGTFHVKYCILCLLLLNSCNILYLIKDSLKLYEIIFFYEMKYF